MANEVFLAAHFLHIVFVAWGLGGAMVALIISRKDDRHPELAPAVMKIMPAISNLIWAAIIGLILTGLVTTSLGIGSGRFDTGILLAKHAVVALLVIAGLYMSLVLLPKMGRLAPKPGAKPGAGFLGVKKQVKITSMASLAMWYIIVLLSVLM